MAIIIPSKNIYRKDNNKSLENKIKKIEVSATEPIKVNEYNVSVHTDTITSFTTEKTNYKNDSNTVTTSVGLTTKTFGDIEIQPIYLRGYTPKIPVFDNNKVISNIYGGVDSQGNPNIKYSVAYTKKYYSITWNGTNYVKTLTSESSAIGKIPLDDLTRKVEWLNTAPLTLELSIKDKTNIANIDFTINTIYDYWWGNRVFDILVGYRSLAQGRVEQPSGTSMLSNSYEVIYEPQRLEITLNGDTLSIDLTDKSLVYGDTTSKAVFSVQNNELLQTTNYLSPNGENALESGLNATIEDFKGGKETATFVCDIGEYYDDNGNLAISAENNNLPMTFRIGDIVLPKVFGANGIDRDMSVDKQGVPKPFKVLGVEPYFDGAVWQKIYAQEV